MEIIWNNENTHILLDSGEHNLCLNLQTNAPVYGTVASS